MHFKILLRLKQPLSLTDSFTDGINEISLTDLQCYNYN